MFFKGYVMTENKKCIEKFKDRTDFKTLEDVQSLPEYAGILAADSILIDIDDMEQSNMLLDDVKRYSFFDGCKAKGSIEIYHCNV